MLAKGDRVVLNRAGTPTGTVQGPEMGGKVYVELDSGSSAAFPSSELSRLESKRWPPEGIETK